MRDTVLENNGEVVVYRASYEPLKPGDHHHPFTSEVGFMAVIIRKEIMPSWTPERFLSEFPVGKHINQVKYPEEQYATE
jgi:hypothetical protein